MTILRRTGLGCLRLLRCLNLCLFWHSLAVRWHTISELWNHQPSPSLFSLATISNATGTRCTAFCPVACSSNYIIWISDTKVLIMSSSTQHRLSIEHALSPPLVTLGDIYAHVKKAITARGHFNPRQKHRRRVRPIPGAPWKCIPFCIEYRVVHVVVE